MDAHKLFLELTRRKMDTLRKPESEVIYQEYLKNKPAGCPFCEVATETWRIQPAKFPYDAVYSRHDLLIAPKHIKGLDDLDLSQVLELNLIIKKLNASGEYDSIMFNFSHKQTVLNHFHLHLLKL